MMSKLRKDTVTLFISNGQGYSRFIIHPVMRRFSLGEASGEAAHGMVVYIFDADGGGLSGILPSASGEMESELQEARYDLLRWLGKAASSSSTGELYERANDLLEGYCADGAAGETDKPWEISGVLRIKLVERFDTGSYFMRHWKITCK